MGAKIIPVFADTDICLDLLSGRQPFNFVAEKLFSLADLGKISINPSPLSALADSQG